MKKIVSLVAVILFAGSMFAQDTLPNFTLTDRGNKVIISWTNPYESLIQLNVQRSFDSLKRFTTIYSTTSPELPQNGFTDTKLLGNHIFYRIFYVLQGGSYFFSVSKSSGVAANQNNAAGDANLMNVGNVATRLVTIKIKDAVFKQLQPAAFKVFRDSILRQTKDTIFAINDSLVGLNPYISKEAWKASLYVYLDKDGYISISVPDVNEKKYNIKFFEDGGAPVFEIHNVKESPLILDKSNFVHAGWYQFELYEDNKLKEKNKFYLLKDF